MGFLDFLKKDHKDPSMPAVDLDAVEKKIGETPDESLDNVPLPPESMRESAFDDMPSSDHSNIPLEAPESPQAHDMMSEPKTEPGERFHFPQEEEDDVPPLGRPDIPLEVPDTPVPDQTPEPAPEPAAGVELPDFSDEDIQEFDNITAATPPEPENEDVMPPPPEPETEHEDFMPPPPEPETEHEDFMPPPPKPVEEPAEEEVYEPDNVKPPEPVRTKTFHNLDHGMFLSSDEHFAITDDISALRASLRKNDELMTNIVSDHDRSDVQLLKIAESMNTVQERLIEIDGVLFEE